METCLGHLKGANSNIALIQTVELHFLNGSATLPLCVSCHLTKKKTKKKNPVVQLKLADELSGSISRRSAHGAAVSLKKLN